MTLKEDTMEYWVDQASQGRNKAECWQNCNRIADDAVEGERERWLEIAKWLNGEAGDFPDLSQKPHYRFRTELRERIKHITTEDNQN